MVETLTNGNQGKVEKHTINFQLLVPPKEIDLMGEEAMANAYNISHNVQVTYLYISTI